MAKSELISEFKAEVIKGIDYSASLGSLSYSAGTSGSVSASVNTSVSLGASFSVSTGVGGSFTLYDSRFSQHLWGGSSGLGEAHQKTYIDTFSIAVGSQDPWMVSMNKIFTVLAIISPAVLLANGAVSGYFRHKNKDWDVSDDVSKIQGYATLSVQNLIALGAGILAVIARVHKNRKTVKSVDDSKATLGISKNARAFLGVQNNTKASGLSFHKGNFELSSISEKSEDGAFSRMGFGTKLDKQGQKYARHGWEVVGFNGSAKRSTKIRGTTQKLDIESPKIWLESKNENKSGKITLGSMAKGQHGVHIEAKGPRAKIDIHSHIDTRVRGGSTKHTAELYLKDKHAVLRAGSAKLALANDVYSVTGYGAGQIIEMKVGGITLKHGSNSIVLNSAGIALAGSAIKIINPSAVPFDIAEKIKAEKEYLEDQISGLEYLTRVNMEFKIDEAMTKLEDMIDKVKSDVGAKLRDLEQK